ncbi:MAG TPA: Gfo/Idh/MocA family oxidoreductase [Thermomicrobiaceae bacterium]|nr:Gfo/Idh/MocA family oxidoreductase [Thermomicrobiaceae bacterium]
MQETPLRVGVIGTGFGAAVHVPGLRQIPGVEVAAICAAHLDHARSAALLHGVPTHFDDYRQMFREAELDAVSIAAPPELHHPIAIAAAESGLHILCEKPMARNAAEARDMFRLARDAGVRTAVDYEHRFTPSRLRVKKLVDSGYLGDFHSLSLTVYRTSWSDRRRHSSSALDEGERAGGVLGALGSDYVDVLRWWFGEVHGVAGATPKPMGSDTFAALLQFASGGIATIHLSTSSPVDLGDEIVVTGSGAMIAVRADGRIFGVRRDEQVVGELAGDEPPAEPAFASPDPRLRPFALLAGEWVRTIRTGKGYAPTFEDGMKVQEVLDSVRRSQELGRWIDTSGKRWPT